MSKILVIGEMLGDNLTSVLHTQINNLCVEEKMDGDEVWGKVTAQKTFEDIKIVLKDYFGDKLKLI